MPKCSPTRREGQNEGEKRRAAQEPAEQQRQRGSAGALGASQGRSRLSPRGALLVAEVDGREEELLLEVGRAQDVVRALADLEGRGRGKSGREGREWEGRNGKGEA